MQFDGINYIAVLIAAFAAFVAGSGYYGAVGKQWMKAIKMPADAQPKMEPSLFVITAICELVLAFMIAGVIGHLGVGQVTLSNGLITGLCLWIGIIMPTMTINHRYQDFGWDLTLIDGMHWFLVTLVIGGVVGFMGV